MTSMSLAMKRRRKLSLFLISKSERESLVFASFSYGVLYSILREEGEADVFTVRRWGEDDEDSESDDETMVNVFDTSSSD
jgi:hypothetical protein